MVLEWLVEYDGVDGTALYARGEADGLQEAQSFVADAVSGFSRKVGQDILTVEGNALVIDIEVKK